MSSIKIYSEQVFYESVNETLRDVLRPRVVEAKRQQYNKIATEMGYGTTEKHNLSAYL